jgi:hypothetical protein
MLYALQKLGCIAVSEPLVGLLAGECVSRQMHGFNPQAISNSTWALANMGCRMPEYYKAVCLAVANGGLAGDKPQGWSNLVYGLALVHHRSPEVMNAMSAAMLEIGGKGLVQQANTQDCANLLWGCATLGWRPSDDLTGVLLGGAECAAGQVSASAYFQQPVGAGCAGPAAKASGSGGATVGQGTQLKHKQLYM